MGQKQNGVPVANTDLGISDDPVMSGDIPFPGIDMLHALSNKLLPILVCSELGLRRCQDAYLCEHFRKILHSVREAQLLVEQCRAGHQEILNEHAGNGSPSSNESHGSV